jgi:hypothetical protein
VDGATGRGASIGGDQPSGIDQVGQGDERHRLPEPLLQPARHCGRQPCLAGPPGPVSVTSRVTPEASHSVRRALSSSRPKKRVNCAGRRGELRAASGRSPARVATAEGATGGGAGAGGERRATTRVRASRRSSRSQASVSST